MMADFPPSSLHPLLAGPLNMAGKIKDDMLFFIQTLAPDGMGVKFLPQLPHTVIP